MCELPWYALAEVFLKNSDSSAEIYCLCSRVFLRNKDDNLKRYAFSAELSASEEELLIDDEVSSECSSLPQILKNRVKQDAEPETVSCYCSASHTDNLSTDEHDSLRDAHDIVRTPHRGLQSSDSGADLTECLRHDIDGDWQRFWSQNGEKLIWESWIAKYSAYIKPDYLHFAQEQAGGAERRERLTLDVEPHIVLSPITESTADDRRSDSEGKNRRLVRNLSGSDDKLNAEVSEGWNPLSPVSVDCETEVEQLLSSRCGSLRTVDSMTNVTRMTISSLDLSQSSHSSDSFSSVSSVQSSLSSEDNEEDYQHQWNVLWKRHYEDELLRQYEIFAGAWKEHNLSGASDAALAERIDGGGIPNSASAYLHVNRQVKQNIHKVFQGKVETDDFRCPIQVNSSVALNLGNLLSSLKMSSEENSKGVDSEYDSAEEEKTQMAAMGLPLRFGSVKRRAGTEEAPEGGSENPVASLSGDFESCRKRIKAAFNLMGIEYHDANGSPLAGQVQYKMKHIRLQNRHLRLRNESTPRPRHLHFDDDGNAIPEAEEPAESNFQSVLPDSSDDKQSSADEDLSEVGTPSKAEEQGEDVTVPKRKKRKKKIVMPPEIKENAHLRKYWHRRFSLFSKFDEGIKLDEESWYSVTPEQIAKHIAQRCACDVIIDGFCGAGGNSIQFALTCKRVIAIDIDPKKIELARNNAEIYGVADRIDFIVGDFFQLAAGLRGDVVFFSPPWGGPSYLKEVVYDLESMLQPVPIAKLLEAGRQITSNIAVFLPKNSNAFLLIDETKPGGGVEIEQNFMAKNLVSITAYYSDLIKKI